MRKLRDIFAEEMKIEFRFGERMMLARQIKHSRACQARGPQGERPGRKVCHILDAG